MYTYAVDIVAEIKFKKSCSGPAINSGRMAVVNLVNRATNQKEQPVSRPEAQLNLASYSFSFALSQESYSITNFTVRQSRSDELGPVTVLLLLLMVHQCSLNWNRFYLIRLESGSASIGADSIG